VRPAFDLQTNRWLLPTSVRQLDAHDRRWERVTGEPQRIVTRGLRWLGLYPRLQSETGQIKQYYVALPDPFVDDTTSPASRSHFTPASSNSRSPISGRRTAKRNSRSPRGPVSRRGGRARGLDRGPRRRPDGPRLCERGGLAAMTTLRALADGVLERLGDVDQTVWSRAEVTGHLQDAYRQLATARPVFYDWTYVENLPRAFSYTQPWEKALLDAMGGFDAGCANFTAEVDRHALSDGRDRRGPANHTSPFEATDGWLASVGASPDISATAELPKTLTAIAASRGTPAASTRSRRAGCRASTRATK
jgi:hypothetical protein